MGNAGSAAEVTLSNFNSIKSVAKRLENPKGFQPLVGGLPAGIRFWCKAGTRRRRCAAVVAACAWQAEPARNCCRVWATRSARRWSALDRWGAFLVLAKSELTALRRDGRGLRLRLVKKRRSSEEAAAEGRFLGNSVS